MTENRNSEEQPELGRAVRLTDVGNGERLVRDHGDRIRYDHAAQAWRIYDGQRWPIDSTGGIMRLAKASVMGIYTEAAQEPDTARRALIAKHAHASESDRRLHAMIAQASTEEGIAVSADAFDSDPFLLNLENGVFDLKLAVLVPHDPGQLITKLAPVEWRTDATCPTWLAFLNRVYDGREDLIAFVQKMAGYCLTGCTNEQALFFLFGLGANGKTITLEVLRALLGDYAMQASFESLLEQRGSGAREDIARLEGARLVTAAESNENRRLNEALIKQMTGGEPIAARHLYQATREYTPQFKLVIAANHKPQIKGVEEAIWRRMRLIPYDVTIPEAERDPNLLDKLLNELPGILIWAIRGCFKWMDEGLGAPADVRAATASYRNEMDTLGDFLNDCCEIAVSESESAKALYLRYSQWCDEAGEHRLTKNQFGRKLTERGFASTKGGTSNSSIRKGLRLNDAGVSGQSGTIFRDCINSPKSTPVKTTLGELVRNVPESPIVPESERGEAWEAEVAA